MDGKFRRKGGNLKLWFKNIIVADYCNIFRPQNCSMMIKWMQFLLMYFLSMNFKNKIFWYGDSQSLEMLIEKNVKT